MEVEMSFPVWVEKEWPEVTSCTHVFVTLYTSPSGQASYCKKCEAVWYGEPPVKPMSTIEAIFETIIERMRV